MGSLGFGELLFIGVVALIVFGPKRLPEIARRAGDLMARARAATKELTESLDAEFEGNAAPLKDLKDEYDATKGQLTDTASKITDMTAIPPRQTDVSGDEGNSSATTEPAEDADGEAPSGGGE